MTPRLHPAGVGVQLFILSLVSNLLMLTGPIFMLQVYDRVLASRSIQTLVALSLLVAVLYAFYGLIDVIRARILARIAGIVDDALSPELFLRTIHPRLSAIGTSAPEPLRDGDFIRQFLASAGPLALLDLPWLPVYLVIVFLFHPMLGWLATAGAATLAVLLVLNEWALRGPGLEAARTTAERQRFTEEARLNAESIFAMGMVPEIVAKWRNISARTLSAQTVSVDRSSTFSAVTRTFRLALQSAVLAAGAYLAIHGEITGGLMIGAAILTSRALAPVEQIVGQWRGFVTARQAYARIRKMRESPLPAAPVTRLPQPGERLTVRNLSTAPIGRSSPIVAGVNFELQAGATLGILGRSGSGKSSLARALVGVWPVLAGEVRFDGSTLAYLDQDQISRMIGYLPQRVELLEGTIADNIARFGTQVRSEDIVKAAETADVHELILSLPDGYDTHIGKGGFDLSAGQRQRIALARALYRDPFLIMLDEPNSNLDAEGEAALTSAIRQSARRGAIVVVVAHRPSAIAAVETLLFLDAGRVHAYGPKEDVIARVTGRSQKTTANSIAPENESSKLG